MIFVKVQALKVSTAHCRWGMGEGWECIYHFLNKNGLETRAKMKNSLLFGECGVWQK